MNNNCFNLLFMGIGKNLQKRLDELEKDQKWLVTQSGVAQQTVSALIKRDSRRSVYTSQLAEAVLLKTDQLISGDWPPLNGHAKEALRVATDAKTKDRENVIFAIVRTLTPEQQEDVLAKLRAAHAANAASAKHVKGILKTVGNKRIEREFGTPGKSKTREKK